MGDIFRLIGAAVASYSTGLLELRNVSLIKNLFLLDPVDETSGPTLSFIGSNKDLYQRIPMTILSTPFGGRSSYYNVDFESTCSPALRSSEAFFQTFRKDSNTSSSEKSIKILVQLPQLGHLQLLDDLDSISFSNICARGSSNYTFVSKQFLVSLLKSSILDSNSAFSRETTMRFLLDYDPKLLPMKWII